MIEQENALLVRILRMRAASNLDTSASLLRALAHSARLGNIAIIHDSMERPAGYIAWACLGKETIRRAAAKGELLLYPEDLNEGYFILVIDVVIRRHASRSLKDAIRQIPARSRCISYFRKGRLKFIKIQQGKAKMHHELKCSLMKFSG